MHLSAHFYQCTETTQLIFHGDGTAGRRSSDRLRPRFPLRAAPRSPTRRPEGRRLPAYYPRQGQRCQDSAWFKTRRGDLAQAHSEPCPRFTAQASIVLVQEGDTLVVWRLDRLRRSLGRLGEGIAALQRSMTLIRSRSRIAPGSPDQRRRRTSHVQVRHLMTDAFRNSLRAHRGGCSVSMCRWPPKACDGRLYTEGRTKC